jgi:hypothetical protein
MAMFGTHTFFRRWILCPLMLGLNASSTILQAAPPFWWSEGNPSVIDLNAASNNHGVANIGQAKWIAYRALATLRQILPQTADAIEADLVGDGKPIATWDIPSTPEQQAKQRQPLMLGQLKAISAPFYLHLHGAAPQWLVEECGRNNISLSTEGLPWTQEVTDDANRSVALIGQLKSLFSLDFAADYETEDHQDGISDLWEHVVVNANPNDEWTGIGDINSGNAGVAGTGTSVGNPPDTMQSPVDPDTDKDGLKDSEDADKDDAAVCWKKTAESEYAVIDLGKPLGDDASDDKYYFDINYDLGEGGHVLASIDRFRQFSIDQGGGHPHGSIVRPVPSLFITRVWQPGSGTWSAPLPVPDDVCGTGKRIDTKGNVYGEAITGGTSVWSTPGYVRTTCHWDSQEGGWAPVESYAARASFNEEGDDGFFYPGSYAGTVFTFHEKAVK